MSSLEPPFKRLSVREIEKNYLETFKKLEEAVEKKQTKHIKKLLDTLPDIRKIPNPKDGVKFRSLARKARRTYIYEEYREEIRKLNTAIELDNITEIERLLKQIPPSEKIPCPYKMFVKKAEERFKRANTSEKKVDTMVRDEIPEELKNREVKNFSVGIDQLYTPHLKKYKKRIGQAKNIIENDPSEDEKRKVKRLVEDLTIAGAPKSMENDLRYVKETLGIK